MVLSNHQFPFFVVCDLRNTTKPVIFPFNVTIYKIHPRHNGRIHGIMINIKSCYTYPLLVPNLPINHPLASIHTSYAFAYRLDVQFRKDVDFTGHHRVFLWQEKMLEKVMTQGMDLNQNTSTNDDLYLAADLPYVRWIQDATPIKALRTSTERMVWHQCLGHSSDYYIYTAHKFNDGVLKFKHNDTILK